MAGREHRYSCSVTWTGNSGAGTRTYSGYGRDHVISMPGKPDILGSSDAKFRGDATRHNPEDLLLASLSSCHMLWYLHLACEAGIVVTGYRDAPQGIMHETADGGGRFSEVVLRPVVTIAAGCDPAIAERVHAAAHAKCFIANSVNFPVRCVPSIETVAV